MRDTIIVVAFMAGVLYLAYTPRERVNICTEYSLASCTDAELYNIGEGLYPTSEMTVEEIEKRVDR